MPSVTVSSRGQITIPIGIRRELGLEVGEELEVLVKGEVLLLVRRRSRVRRSGWRSWGGVLAGADALREHRREPSRRKVSSR